MKKLIKFILIFILSIIILVVALVAFVAFMLYDGTNELNSDIVEANKSTETVLSSLNYDALEETDEDKLGYGFSEYKLNELLYSLTNSVVTDNDIIEFKGAYAKYHSDGTFSFYAPIKLKYKGITFKSLISANLNVEDTDEKIILTLKKVKVSKLSSTNFIIKNTLKQALNTDDIENQINSNLKINVDVEYTDGEFIVSILNEDIFNLIKDSVSSDNKLFTTLIDVVIDNNQVYDIDFSSETKGFFINLKELESEINSSYSLENKTTSTGSSIEALVMAKGETLLQNGMSEENVTLVINFMIRGYEHLTTTEQEKILSLDLSTIGYSDEDSKKNEAGVFRKYDAATKGVDEIIDESIPTVSVSELTEAGNALTVNVNLSNASLNKIINDEDFLGTTFVVYNDNNQLNYISFSNVYITVEYHKITLSLVLDLNGKEIKADMTLGCSTVGNEYELTASLDAITFGSISLDDNQRFTILEYLAESIDNEEFLKVNSDNKTVTVNLSKYFENNEADNTATETEYYKVTVDNEIEMVDGGVEVRYLYKLTPKTTVTA